MDIPGILGEFTLKENRSYPSRQEYFRTQRVHSRKAERPPRYPRQGRPQDNPVGGEPTRLESPGYPITNATTERSMHLSETASSGSLRPRQMVPLLNRLKSINPLA